MHDFRFPKLKSVGRRSRQSDVIRGGYRADADVLKILFEKVDSAVTGIVPVEVRVDSPVVVGEAVQWPDRGSNRNAVAARPKKGKGIIQHLDRVERVLQDVGDDDGAERHVWGKK